MSNIAEKFEIIADEVYKKGREDEWNQFWDIFQANGTRTDYSKAFHGNFWNENIFKPKYKMQPTNAENMFNKTTLTDGELLRDKVDFSKDTSGYAVFFNSKIQTLPLIDFSSANNLNSTFGYCSQLTRIEKLILNNNGTTTFSNGCFQSASNLSYIRFEGVIGNTLNLNWCPLTIDSILNIFEHLKDVSGTGETRTLSLGTTNLAKLSDSEKAIATEKGWTLA